MVSKNKIIRSLRARQRQLEDDLSHWDDVIQAKRKEIQTQTDQIQRLRQEIDMVKLRLGASDRQLRVDL